MTTASDVVDANDGVTSLREAVAYANSNSGADTIRFAANLAGQTITLTNGELQLTDTTGTTTITGLGADQLTISGNNASRVFNVAPNASVAISGVTITDGYDASAGGGICNTGVLTITNSILSGNSTDGVGGGIYNTYGTLTLTNSILSANSATYDGGGIYNISGTVILNGSTLSANSAGNISKSAGGSGGGVCNYGVLTITDSTISGNSATYGDGGGIYNISAGGTLTITDSTVSGNWALFDGGGVENTVGTSIIINCTFSGNSATTGNGGGINNDLSGSTLTLTNSTIAGNSAYLQGGGIHSQIAWSVTLANTIVAGNSNTNSTSPDISGAVTADYCLIQSIAGAVVDSTTHNLYQDPLLSTLRNYGGPTQTIALLPGSPAIDAGSNTLASGLTTDQRGYARIVNGTVDIGAYESALNPTAPTGATISAPTDGYHGVRGQVRTVVLTATDPSLVDQAGNFTFAVDWGDGTLENIVCHSGQTASHVYAAAGTYVARITSVADQNGATTTFTGVQQNMTIGTVEVQGTMLAVGGTTGNDAFVVTDGASPGTVTITLGGTSRGTFSGISSVLCFGQGGTDAVTVQGTAGNDSFTMNGDLITVNDITVDGDSIESWLVNGLAGNDVFAVLPAVGTEPVAINGGTGTDTLDYSLMTGPVTVNLRR